MGLQRFEATQTVPVPLEEAWDFFIDPRNLTRITPPDMGFEVTSTIPERAYPGLIISYKVRPLFGVPVEWVTEITHIVEGSMFVDEQRAGPYRLWHHEHWMRAVPGGTEMRDIVSYVLPFGPFGAVANGLVRRRLEHIFDYRSGVLRQVFRGARPSNGAAPAMQPAPDFGSA
jgi:ligand-binding SRPBCC domain-containing protein